MREPESKILTREAMRVERARLKAEGRTLVFTNGCFDILHAGHVSYLDFARRQGDALAVGLNADASVRRAKGPTRPVNPQQDRALVLAALEAVDYVIVFEEDEPIGLIGAILPDVLVKGADWAHYVSGRDLVEAAGGRVVLAELVPGRSTTGMINRMKQPAPPRLRQDVIMKNTDTLIITGGAGLIGSNLAAALNARGYRNLVIVDHLNHPAKEANLKKLAYTDFIDKQDFRRLFTSGKQPHAAAVFHLGACSSTTETDAAYLDDNNLAYTRDLCEWSLRHGARFIYASSAATYGDGSRGYSDNEADIPNLQPLNLYGLSKQRFDLWALENRLLDRIAGIKYFNVFGPGEDHKGDMRSVVNKAFRQIAGTGRLELFRSHRPEYADGMQERDFVYVKDAVAITLFFLDNPGVSGIFNAGTGRTHTWIDLANAVFAALEREPHIDFIDMPETLRDKYQYYTLADIRKLRAAGFNAAFLPLADAVADYAQNRLD